MNIAFSVVKNKHDFNERILLANNQLHPGLDPTTNSETTNPDFSQIFNEKKNIRICKTCSKKILWKFRFVVLELVVG